MWGLCANPTGRGGGFPKVKMKSKNTLPPISGSENMNLIVVPPNFDPIYHFLTPSGPPAPQQRSDTPPPPPRHRAARSFGEPDAPLRRALFQRAGRPAAPRAFAETRTRRRAAHFFREPDAPPRRALFQSAGRAAAPRAFQEPDAPPRRALLPPPPPPPAPMVRHAPPNPRSVAPPPPLQRSISPPPLPAAAPRAF